MALEKNQGQRVMALT